MINLLDYLQEHLSPHFIHDAAEQLGENEVSVSKAIRGLSAAFLAGMLQKAEETAAMEQVFGHLRLFPTEVSDHPERLLVPGNLAHNDPKDAAGHFAGYLFGSKVPALINSTAAFSGAKSSSISFLLGVAGSLVMSVLAKRIRDGECNVSGLFNILNGNQERITTALPSGLGSLLGLAQQSQIVEAPEPSAVLGSGWSRALMLLLVFGIAMLFGMRQCGS